MKTPTRRKVISIAISDGTPANQTLVALCDDGTIWSKPVRSDQPDWIRIPDIPQDFEPAEPLTLN